MDTLAQSIWASRFWAWGLTRSATVRLLLLRLGLGLRLLPLLLNLLLSLLFDLPLPLLLLLLALLFNLPLALFQLLLSLLLHLALTLLLLLLLLQLNLLLPLLFEVELVFLRRRHARRRESFGSGQALALGCGLSLTWLQLLRTRLLDGGRAGRGRCGRRGALLEDRGFGQWLGLPWLRWLPRLLCKRLTRRRYSWRNVFCGRRRLPLRQRLHCLGRCSRWLDRGLAGLCRANRGNDRQWHALQLGSRSNRVGDGGFLSRQRRKLQQRRRLYQ